MTTTTTNDDAPMTHGEALDLICKACTVTILSYDEAIAIYLRARGFLRDGSPVMGAPVPDDWAPEPIANSIERVLKMIGAYDPVTGARDVQQIALHAIVAVWAQFPKELRNKPSAALVGPIGEIAAERRRQIEVEGFSPYHDDKFDHGEIAKGAAAYAMRAGLNEQRGEACRSRSDYWPGTWRGSLWKPTTSRRNLIKAAAMIVAEIERIDRAAAKGGAQ